MTIQSYFPIPNKLIFSKGDMDNKEQFIINAC